MRVYIKHFFVHLFNNYSSSEVYFRTLSNIYSGAFLLQKLMAFSPLNCISENLKVLKNLSDFLVQVPCLDELTHFRPMFHLCRNQVVGFYQQNV